MGVRILFWIVCSGWCLQSLAAEPLQLSVKADGAILMNAETGAVLFEKDPHKTFYPASLTKAATALYTLNRGGTSLDTVLVVEGDAIASVSEAAKKRANYTLPAYWLEPDGTHIGLKKGEQVALRDLMYGLMLSSGNDAANVIGQYVGGSVPQFMDGVNAYLREIGCLNTRLLNPHGLHHPEHVSTAFDLALIGCAGLKNGTFSEIVSTVRYTKPKSNLQDATTFVQGNRLLRKGQHYYPKAIGLKTGYHARAQHNLIAAARHGDRTLVAVLLHNADRSEMFKEAVRLFETAFKQPQVQRTVLQAGPQAYALKLRGSSKAVETYLDQPVTVAYYPAEEPKLNALLFWDELTLPVAKGQRVGEIRITAERDRPIATAPLYALREVKPSMWHRFSQAVSGVNVYVWGALAILLLALVVWGVRAVRYR